MTDETGRSPFDLEDEAPPPPTPGDGLADTAAAPPPRRKRRGERPAGRRYRLEVGDAGADAGASGRIGGFFWGLFTGPRFFYALSSVLIVALLFVLYNPDFGLQVGAWFWEALQGKAGPAAYGWNPTLLQAVVLPLFALAFAAAALSGERSGRATWAAFWVLAAFITFQIAREELRYFLPPILAMAAIGLLIRQARGGVARQATWIVIIALGTFLWLPLPDAQASHDAVDFDTGSYRCTAIGIVDLLIEAPGDPDDGALARRGKLLLLELPQYISLLAWVLLLAAGLGARGRWLGWAGGALLLIYLVGLTWMQFDIGTARTEGAKGPGPDWWSGARQVADAWRARFVVFMPALVAAVADLRSPRGAGA